MPTLETLTTLAVVAITLGIAMGLLSLALAQYVRGVERLTYRLIAVALFVFDAIALLALTA